MDETNWFASFITQEKWYVAWDETQAGIIGKYKTYEEAKQAIINYAKNLDYDQEY
jgi:rRNA processing protein Krr1/Pno1